MSQPRYLVVIADDFGMGPAVSRAILELAVEGRVDGTVLLVNSPHAEEAVRAWHKAGRPLEVGWHPCLTLDRPVLPAERVPSLVDTDGCFWPLGRFLLRALTGRLRVEEVRCELRAQYRRFHDLLGRPPTLINSHQHTQILSAVGEPLLDLLGRCRRLPYLRRICEPWGMLACVPGARIKRAFLSFLGRRQARLLERAGFPGNDWLAGITDPRWVEDPNFLVRWLTRVPGKVVELTCHPGYLDLTLVGRDCTLDDGHLRRRVRELELLRHPSFPEACADAGFCRASPAELNRRHVWSSGLAA
jgi:predicted glycoside hydrolase/deacetylase ChbG (UPF0249 family)